MKKPAISLLLLLLLSCNKESHPITIVVYNKGVAGNTSAQLVERVDKDVLSLSPKLVIIMIGTNDVGRKLPYEQYKANVTMLVNKIQEQGAKVMLLSPPPRGTAEIKSSSDFLNDRNDKINLILDTLSRQLNCFYLDINSAFKKAGSPNATAGSYILNQANSPDKPDGVHLTSEGGRFLAARVKEYMVNNNLTSLNLIICFGDSLTAGSGYPIALQASLN